MMGRTKFDRSVALIGVAVSAMAVVLASCVIPPPPPPQTPPGQPGDPSGQGPHAVSQATVGSGFGFGGGTIYYPTDTTLGLRGGVAVVPGFIEGQSAVSWYGPRLASHGFITITIDANSNFDQPAARGDQLLAALTYLTTRSTVASRVDPNRLAVMGHSMGGGGALAAAGKNHSIRAAIPLAGWHTKTDWSSNTSPTLVVACESDTVAPAASHSMPFYNSLTTEKAFLEIAGGSHSCTNSSNSTISKSVVSWLTHFVDGDGRYDNHLCPVPAPGGAISRYLATCPY